MFDAVVLRVMISSPGDTVEEVAAVKEALHDWNASRTESAHVILLPRHWKSDAVPRMSPSGAQGIINKHLVDSADIVVALFDTRLGQATPNAVSGTAEEIHRATEAGKIVHVWFSAEDIQRGADLDQLARLQDYRKTLGGQALLGEYASPSDLAHQVRNAIEHDVAEMGLASLTGT